MPMDVARKVVVPEETQAMVADDPWVTLKEAAQIRGRDRYTVLMETLDAKIRTRKVARRRVFHRDDLAALRAAEAAGAPDAGASDIDH